MRERADIASFVPCIDFSIRAALTRYFDKRDADDAFQRTHVATRGTTLRAVAMMISLAMLTCVDYARRRFISGGIAAGRI